MRKHLICALFLVVLLRGQQLQFEKTVRLEANARLALAGWRAGQIYSISARSTVALKQPLALGVVSGGRRLLTKTLHSGDTDVVAMVRAAGETYLEVNSATTGLKVRVIEGRLAVEKRLADKFSTFLETKPDGARKRLLAGLVELPLRRADIYDPLADSEHGFVPVYNRIGNDVEQSVFFGESNTRFATALLPLVSSADLDLRRLAMGAAQLTRDARFGAVTAISGKPGVVRDELVKAAKVDIQVPENAELLKAFNQFPRPPAAAKGMVRTGARPDESFYRGYVEPIFLKRGKDGYACVQCHAAHTAFNATYSTVFGVVNLENPEESLLLKKPTWTAEGTIGAQSHGGGARFERDSPEYTTILNWLRGVKE